jgi:hypothetical protein
MKCIPTAIRLICDTGQHLVNGVGSRILLVIVLRIAVAKTGQKQREPRG